jgi:hypothetical protein
MLIPARLGRCDVLRCDLANVCMNKWCFRVPAPYSLDVLYSYVCLGALNVGIVSSLIPVKVRDPLMPCNRCSKCAPAFAHKRLNTSSHCLFSRAALKCLRISFVRARLLQNINNICSTLRSNFGNVLYKRGNGELHAKVAKFL